MGALEAVFLPAGVFAPTPGAGIGHPRRVRRFADRAILYQFVYSMTGLVLGLIAMAFGALLFLFGVTGETNWSARFLGSSSTLSDAAPGTVLFIVGVLAVFVTRFTVKVQESSSPTPQSSPQPGPAARRKRSPAAAPKK